MLTRKQLDRYSDVLLWALHTARKEKFRKYDIVFLRFDTGAFGLAEMLQWKLLDKGFNPVLWFFAAGLLGLIFLLLLPSANEYGISRIEREHRIARANNIGWFIVGAAIFLIVAKFGCGL